MKNKPKPKKQNSNINPISIRIDMLHNKLKFISNLRSNFDRADQSNLEYKDLVAKFGKINSIDELNKVEYKINNTIQVLNKKEKTDREYKDYRKTNNIFELTRRRFYDTLNTAKKQENMNIGSENIRPFWENLWKKDKQFKPDFDEIIKIFKTKTNKISEPEINDLKFEEFEFAIKKLSPWKAAGPDGIYNFWIKHITALHKVLH
ncbi:hypothetical protein DMUE_2950 [Dictyocoela muelleri]|nr:hypothetical protein DMUE_2950 [Dictyocoela muelleri]